MYIAHRGLHNSVMPENSLAAFKNAIDHGYAIELDIQMTKDNVLIILHDFDTLRMTGVKKVITKSTYEEIKKLSLKETKEHIPTLQSVLDLVGGKVYLDIEIKRRNRSRKFLRLIKEALDAYEGEYSIKSFDPLIPWWYKRHNKNIKCGVLSYNHNDYKAPKFFRVLMQKCKYFWFYKPDFIAYRLQDYTEELNKRLKKENMPLMLWTITAKEELKEAKKYTNDIVFEKIDIKKEDHKSK